MTEPRWRKSSYSGHEGDCVEVTGLDADTVGLRDSKLGEDSVVLRLTRGRFRDLVARIRVGTFDHLQ